VLKNICNPFCVLLVSFFTANGFKVLGVCKDNIAGVFQNIVNRMPIFACRFHANIPAIVLIEPVCEFAQIFGVGGKAFGFVGCNAFVVR